MTGGRVGLACGNAITRAGLADLLEGAGFALGPQPASLDELEPAAAGDRPDVWIVDDRLPGGPVAAVEALAARGAARIVVLSDERDERAVLEVLAAGACGHLPTDTPAERLPAILRAVLDGEAAVPRGMLGRLLAHMHATRRRITVTRADGTAVTLTARESAILEALARGASTDAIAAELGVSPVTVRRHTSNALRKLGAATRAEALSLLQSAGSR